MFKKEYPYKFLSEQHKKNISSALLKSEFNIIFRQKIKESQNSGRFKKGHFPYSFWKGKHLSQSTKNKISQKRKKYFLLHPEAKENLRKKHIGKILSEKTRKKIGEWNSKFKTYSLETKEKIRNSKLGKNNPNWKGGISKLTICIDYGKQLKNYKAKRCLKCHSIFYRGEKHHSWVIDKGASKRRANRRYKIAKRGGGKLTLKTIQLIYEDNIKQYGTLTCYLCKKPIEFGEDTLEHKIPLFRNGTNEYNNLAIAHKKCNSSKGKQTFDEWKISHPAKNEWIVENLNEENKE